VAHVKLASFEAEDKVMAKWRKESLKLKKNHGRMRLPPIDWSELPLSQLIREIVNNDHRPVVDEGEIIEAKREDIELARTEICFTDPVEDRKAHSQICLARWAHIQSWITFDFWPEDAARLSAVWNEALNSLELGLFIKDPTRGPIIH